jgi:hypothetical protein
MVNRANKKVPVIKPNCTADVKFPKALSGRLKVIDKLFMIPFPANHNEVQKNCEITIIDKILCVAFKK